jgi:hypothetical protein
MWHDYAATTGVTAGTYSMEMYTNTIRYAYERGSEFVTLDDLQNRIRSLESASLDVTGSNPASITVDGASVGQFSLLVDTPIQSVGNWYAYDADQVFLPENGGEFLISFGDTPEDVTRISALPMRARLHEVTGDGQNLSFSFTGQGVVRVELNSQLLQDPMVTGADSYTIDQGSLYISCLTDTLHTVNITEQSATEVTFVSIGREDGWVREWHEYADIGLSYNYYKSDSMAIRIGDHRWDRQYKSILSFDTSSLPDNVEIVSARLELTRGGTSGTNPFSSLGPATIDIKKGFFGYRSRLESQDYQASADANQIAQFSEQGGSMTTYQADLTNGLPYINTLGRTQLRLSFTKGDNDNWQEDLAGFYSGDTGNSALRPRLIISYR